MFRIATLALSLLFSAMTIASEPDIQDKRLIPASMSFVQTKDVSSIPEVYVDGYIQRATVDEFRKHGYLNGRQVGFVYFNSLGGDVIAAMELGVLIRERGFSTRIGARNGPNAKPSPGHCESACPFAFAGGVFRLMDGDSKLGLHQFFLASGVAGDNDMATGQITSTLLANHLSNLGINLRVLEVAAKAGPKEMNYLSPLEAYEMDLVNAGSLPATWEIKGEKGLVYLLGQQTKISGTGRLGMSCNPHNGVSMAAFFKAWYDTNMLSTMDRFALTVDGKSYPIAQGTIGPHLKNGFSYVTFEPTPEQLQVFKSGRTVGFSYQKAGTELSANFTIDVNDAQGMIDSFSLLCGGARPSFNQKI
jgi:hypothetical protein